jgi:chemotaxis protein CheD
MGEALMVGMAEVKVTRSPEDVLVALGLGSCIGICAFDPQARIAGLAHVVLPDSGEHQGTPGKFANTAVPLLLEEMQKLGAHVSRICVALTGGAQLFSYQGSGPRLEIGPRNTAAVEAELERRKIRIVASDVGGSSGRTVHLFSDGRVRVKSIGQGERDLITLGQGTLGVGKAPSLPKPGSAPVRTAATRIAGREPFPTR